MKQGESLVFMNELPKSNTDTILLLPPSYQIIMLSSEWLGFNHYLSDTD